MANPGIKWSDGKDFTADDVTFTLNACKEYGAKIRWGTNVAQVMDKAETIDQQTVKVTLTVPAPRFFWLLTYHFDIGVYMLPKHIFEGQDVSTFSHFDLAKGLPVTTSPWRVVHSSPQQKILDRADDWWGVAAGVAPLPAVERFICCPIRASSNLIQSIIKNEVDFTTGIQPSSFPTVINGNPKATSWTGTETPYGYVDWWPHSLYVNNEVAPWSDKNVRWALSYYIDRSKIVDIAWSGASKATPLPMPDYPPLQPYFDATKPLLEKYNTLEYNPEKGDALLTAKGWKKDANGMWQDETGNRSSSTSSASSTSPAWGPCGSKCCNAAGLTPAILNRQISSTTSPPANSPAVSLATVAVAANRRRHWRSTRALRKRSPVVTPSTSRAGTTPSSTNSPMKRIPPRRRTRRSSIDIWVKAMEIWLPELPDIQLTQGFHRLPWTTEYWTNMPDENNPYTNSAQWHLTFPLVLHNVKPSA